jgi:hypothetical protein
MTADFEQITSIIKNNPAKGLISDARATADKLMMHVFGRNLQNSITNYGYFENNDVYKERKAGAISNKDLFARLLQREEMVFSAQGGASYYDGLNEGQTLEFDATLDNIRFNTTIRKWIKEFALNAYRTDPMSVLFIEVSTDGKKAYPTYKSISCIYDYQTNGRSVEYICFKLTAQDCANFGIVDETLKDLPAGDATEYYRFVDDSFDYILKNEDGVIKIYNGKNGQVPNRFKVVPAIVSSDIINFTNTAKFESPLFDVIELADTFLTDRSIRDLSKKYSGFPKAIEPLLNCGTCGGTGYLSGAACPACTLPGQDKGTGFKLTTKVSDVARFPIDDKSGFDFNKYFGYIAPPVDVWNKQDTSLNDTENFIRDVYWGTYNRQSTTGPTKGQATIEETATKTLADLQPIYERLNLTADWAESTENALCNLLGFFYFDKTFIKSIRTYGRDYILETPDELIAQYLDEKTKHAPQTTLSDTLRKYYHARYNDNKVKLHVMLKLMNVEPFVHYTATEVQSMNTAKIDEVCKVYYNEWLATVDDNYLVVTDEKIMTANLLAYATAKSLEAPYLIVDPTLTITDNIRTT